jgi:hypothetical protein
VNLNITSNIQKNCANASREKASFVGSANEARQYACGSTLTGSARTDSNQEPERALGAFMKMLEAKPLLSALAADYLARVAAETPPCAEWAMPNTTVGHDSR